MHVFQNCYHKANFCISALTHPKRIYRHGHQLFCAFSFHVPQMFSSFLILFMKHVPIWPQNVTVSCPQSYKADFLFSCGMNIYLQEVSHGPRRGSIPASNPSPRHLPRMGLGPGRVTAHPLPGQLPLLRPLVVTRRPKTHPNGMFCSLCSYPPTQS